MMNSCPWCKHRIVTNDKGIAYIDGKLDMHPAKPKDGSLTLCVECGEWAVFSKRLRLRKPRDEELMKIGFDPDCQTIRAAWVAWRASEEETKASL